MEFRLAKETAGIVSIYDVYRVQARTANRLLGGKPAKLDAVLTMLDARAKRGEMPVEVADAYRDAASKRYEPVDTEATETAEKDAEGGILNIFYATDNGPVIGSNQIKAGLRECFQVQGVFQKRRGSRQPFQHAFFVVGSGVADDADNVHFRDENDVTLGAPDGVIQRVGHIVGPQGPRSIVTLNEYMEPNRRFTFDVLLNDYADRLSYECLIQALDLLQNDGLGATRSQGYGRVEILDIEKITERKVPSLITKLAKKRS